MYYKMSKQNTCFKNNILGSSPTGKVWNVSLNCSLNSV